MDSCKEVFGLERRAGTRLDHGGGEGLHLRDHLPAPLSTQCVSSLAVKRGGEIKVLWQDQLPGGCCPAIAMA